MKLERCVQREDIGKVCPNGGGGRIGGHHYNIHLTGVSYYCACGCRMSPYSSQAPDHAPTVDPFGACPLVSWLDRHGWPTQLVDAGGFSCACGSRLSYIQPAGSNAKIVPHQLTEWFAHHRGHIEHLITQPAPQPPQPELPMTESTTSPSKIDRFFDLLCEVTGRGKVINHGQPWSESSPSRKFAIVVDSEGDLVADCSTSNVADLLIILNDVADEVIGLQKAPTEYSQLQALYTSVLEDRDTLAKSNKEMVGRLANIKAKHSAELNAQRVTGRHDNHDKHGGAAKNDGRWCDPSCSACSYEATGWRRALEPINEMLRSIGYTGETTDMVKELYARNCELSAEAVEPLESVKLRSIKVTIDIETNKDENRYGPVQMNEDETLEAFAERVKQDILDCVRCELA